FTTLHSFNGESDGANPLGSLIQLGGTLYGTTSSGTIFAINTNGGGFTNLPRFLIYADGCSPDSGLIASGDTLCGTTFAGGIGAAGTLYSLNPDGAAFTTLYSFTLVNNDHSGPPTNVDGCGPLAGLVLSGNTLYGATYQAGSSGYGTLFSFSVRPQLTITPAGASMILTWPTNTVGFLLQSATNLGSSAWTLVSPPPLVINGQNTVTNTVSSSQVFYRLVQ